MPQPDQGSGGRAYDALSWRESTRVAWSWTKWVALIIPGGPLGCWLMMKLIFLEPTTPQQAAEIDKITSGFLTIMPLIALVMWLLIFGNAILQARWSETPSEAEARERRQLARLKAKYGDDN